MIILHMRPKRSILGFRWIARYSINLDGYSLLDSIKALVKCLVHIHNKHPNSELFHPNDNIKPTTMPESTKDTNPLVNYMFLGYFIHEGKRYDVHYNDGQMLVANGRNDAIAFDIPFDQFNRPKPIENHAKNIIEKKLKKH